MHDARSESAESLPVPSSKGELTWMYKQATSWMGVFAFVMAGIVWADPSMRAQVRDVYLSMTATEAAPLVVATPPVPAVAIPVALPMHNKAFTLLGNVVHAQPVKVAAVEENNDGQASPAQIEGLRRYIARKYRVSHDATEVLVKAAYGVGQDMDLDPLLLLSVVAIESRFNPFAESGVGAQGLMQVMTSVHHEKFKSFGGSQAAWNPIANMRVGAMILQDCIARGGSIEAGLKRYVGATGPNDGGYGAKVLAERQRLASAAGVRAAPSKPADAVAEAGVAKGGKPQEQSVAAL
jgi:soluble lytic murein transglycosylase-like protein